MTTVADRKHTLADVKVVGYGMASVTDDAPPEARTIPVKHLDSGTRYVEFPQQGDASSVTVVGWEPKPGVLYSVGYQYIYLHYRDHLVLDSVKPVYEEDKDSVIAVRTKYGKDATVEFIPRACLDTAITAAQKRLDGLKSLRR